MASPEMMEPNDDPSMDLDAFAEWLETLEGRALWAKSVEEAAEASVLESEPKVEREAEQPKVEPRPVPKPVQKVDQAVKEKRKQLATVVISVIKGLADSPQEQIDLLEEAIKSLKA